MYPEFIPIYVGLAIIIVLLVVILILVLKRPSNRGTMPKGNASHNMSEHNGGNIVFCKNCATQFEASQRYCPKCGTPR